MFFIIKFLIITFINVSLNINLKYQSFITTRIPWSRAKCVNFQLLLKFNNKSDNKNLFKKQLEDYQFNTPPPNNVKHEKRWQDLVFEEVIKNRNRHEGDNFLYGELDTFDSESYKNLSDNTFDKKNYDYRLSPEGRLLIEDRIEYLRRQAHTNPGHRKPTRPTLWIVRPAEGNYCELLKKDEERIKSLVDRVRKIFSKNDLEILVLKLDVKMPLCEIVVEGSLPDIARILYARGGTLQFYVTPRFWTYCDLLEKDPRLEAKYGRSAAPGLFPQWDEDGMIEEITDCMDIRPDYSLELRQPNAWNMLPMLPKYDKDLMLAYFEHVHWPTRLKVQKAFEDGIEDYRHVIAEEYKRLQRLTRYHSKLLDEWM